MYDEAERTQPGKGEGEGSEYEFVEPTSFPLFFGAAKMRIVNPVLSNGEDVIDRGKGKEIARGLETFPLFMALPMEIRLEIWKLALPGPRTLHVYDCFLEGYAPELYNREALYMPLAATCRESRAFVMDYGYEPLWPHLLNPRDREPFRGPWFCRGRDVVRDIYNDMGLFARLCPPGGALDGLKSCRS